MPPDIRAHSYNAAMEMYKWTIEDMLKGLETWKDYYLSYNSFKVADALDEIITWFRSPSIWEE